MGELSEARRDLIDSVAEEFLHNAWAGRRLLAVEAAEDEDAARFADDLAAALVARGQTAVRRPPSDGRRLLNQSVRGIWHFAVWTLRDDELPHGSADVNVDVSDESAPTRYFYDLCKLPPSFGERRADPSMHVVETGA